MPEDPTKVLDALQSLVARSKVSEGALPLTAACRKAEHFRSALDIADSESASGRGARVDHLRRVEARGPGPKTTALGPYEVDLVCFQPLDAVDRVRVWHDGHLVAEIELASSARKPGVIWQPASPD